MGIRARYWFMNMGHEFSPPAPETLNIQMDAVDLEFTLDEHMGEWDFLVAGGLRYARQQYRLGPSLLAFEGSGITVAAEATRSVGCRGFYLVGNTRGSLLIGEIRNPAGIIGGPRVLNDELATVLEAQLGLGWIRETGWGELNLRAVAEAQGWFNDNLADPFCWNRLTSRPRGPDALR